jgi:hypothetical protein
MCFYTQQHASIKDVTKRFNAAVDDPDGFGVEMINGFAHLKTPIIVDETLMLYLPIIVEDLFRRG